MAPRRNKNASVLRPGGALETVFSIHDPVVATSTEPVTVPSPPPPRQHQTHQPCQPHQPSQSQAQAQARTTAVRPAGSGQDYHARTGGTVLQSTPKEPAIAASEASVDIPQPRVVSGGHTVRFAQQSEDSSSTEEFNFDDLPDSPTARVSVQVPQHTSQHPQIATQPSTPRTRSPNFQSRAVRTPQRPRTLGTPRSWLPPKPRRRAGTSGGRRALDVWEFFPGDGHHCLFCNELKKQQKNAPFNDYQSQGTDDRRKHLVKYHLKPWIEQCVASGYSLTSELAKKALQDHRSKYTTEGPAEFKPELDNNVPVYSREAMVDAIMYHIIADDESIGVIESPFFRKMIRTLWNELKDLDILKADSMKKRIEETLDEYLDKMKQEMLETSEGDIQFTDDIWTDTKLRSFLAITGHWIQAVKAKTSAGTETTELVYQSDLIGFVRIPGRHTGENIAQCFIFALKRLGLTEMVGHITSDNASNNDTFMVKLVEMLRKEGVFVEWDPQDRRIRCFAHIVNLSCKSVLAAMNNIEDNIIQRLRDMIRSVRSSGLRRDYFLHCTEKVSNEKDHLSGLQLLLDVNTRWSSTYLMIDRALTLRPALSQFFTNDDYRSLNTVTPDDWATLENVRDVLEVPHLFQQRLSAEKTPTLCWALPSFAAMVTEYKFQIERFPYLADAIQLGLDKLNEYYERIIDIPVYVLAMVLNPEVKLSFYNNLYDREHVKAYRNDEEEEDVTHQISELTLAQRFLRGTVNLHGTSMKPSVEEEVNLYLAERCLQSIDPLTYWKDNQKRYLTLYKLAMNVLPIQGTSVPCERVFSSAKHTLTDNQTSLSARLVEALQILKFALKHGQGLDFTSDYSAAVQLNHLETLTHNEYCMPTYLKALVVVDL